MSSLDPNFTHLVRRCRRRPFLHAGAAALAGASLWRLAWLATGPGLPSLWPAGLAAACAVLAYLGVAVLDGSSDSRAPVWTAEDVDGAVLDLPLPPDSGADVWARAAATVWAGWIAGLLAFGLADLAAGTLTFARAFGLAMVMTWTSIAGMWGTTILPTLWPSPPVAATVRVRLERHRVSVDGRAATLADRAPQLLVDGQWGELVLFTEGGAVRLVGDAEHLRAIVARIAELPARGQAAEVPAALSELRS